jgi:hypothetical protein
VTAKLPATWNFTGKGGDVALKLSEDYIAGSGVQEKSAEIKDRRPGVRGLRHRSARIQMG